MSNIGSLEEDFNVQNKVILENILYQKLEKLKEKNGLNLNVNFLLDLVLLMRVVPRRWIGGLYKHYNIKKDKCSNVITNAKRLEYLNVFEDITDEKLLYLTPKGFRKATQNISVGYKYKEWTKNAVRTGSIYQEHHYILFRYFLDYFSCFEKADTVYTDYDKKFYLEYLGKDTIIRPDGIIRPTDGDYYDLICIEADTGTMTQTALYDKFLRYFLFALNNFGSQPIQTLKICLTCKTRNRFESIFNLNNSKNSGQLFKYFEKMSLNFRLSKRKKFIPIEYVYKLFNTGKIKVYAGVFSEGINQFEEIDFWGKIVEANPKWKRVIERM